MVKDALGDRMKEYYEGVTKTKLVRRMPVIIRLDGCHFHTFTRGFRKPFDELLNKTMQATMKYLCENIQGVVLGYTQSDEITLILVDYAKLETSAWFDYEIQKIVSVSAALATYAFNKYFNEFYLYQLAEKCGETDEFDLVYDRARKKGAYFDSRAFNIPKEEVTNCVLWRQLDAERNSVNSLGQSLFPHKALQGLSCKALKAKIEEEKGIVWGNLPTEQKRGTCCIKNRTYTLPDGQVVKEKEYINYKGHFGTFYFDGDGYYFFYRDNESYEVKSIKLEVKEHAEWVIDKDIPRFIDSGREYIEKLINVGE